VGLLARAAHDVGKQSGLFLRATAVVIAIAASVLATRPAVAQISPGPLSKAHRSLTGTTQCASCHQFGASTPTFNASIAIRKWRNGFSRGTGITRDSG
jgi:hypothetical protein